MTDDLIGKTLGGRYSILEKIKEGGMAAVYKALDTQFDRQVAIKVILPNRKLSEKFLARFKREARLQANLSHPNILKMYDYGEFDNQPFLVTEYISGGTLKEMIDIKKMPWQKAAQILAFVGRALEAAHAQGIIHRDVKPSNILMANKRDPILSDFGIAKLIENDEETTDLTGLGPIGTYKYMAPEQGSGEADERSDIYALGVVYYQMVTGRLPIEADTDLSLMLKKNATPPTRPRHFVPDLPTEIEKALLKALAIKPGKRYQNMSEFVRVLDLLARYSGSKEEKRELERLAKVDDVLPPPPPPPPRLWLFVIIGIVLMLCVGAAGYAIPRLEDVIQTLFPEPTSTKVPTRTPNPTPRATKTPVSTPTSSILLDEITDEKGAVMRLVREGEFTMGSNDFGDEMPPHQVYLDTYYIDKYEVTNTLYNACVDAGKCEPAKDVLTITSSSYFRNSQYADYPVTSVNWYQAQIYCEWRGARLPTEAEWEKAARGEDAFVYPWGNSLQCENGNFDDEIEMDNYLAVKRNCDGYPRTSPVGVFNGGKSPFGIYDMAGNVWEWVSDWYGIGYYADSPAENPQGPLTGESRSLRGGSWDDKSKYLRSATRGKGGPEHVSLDLGFRCASSLP